jgi:hypothetical protein
MFTSSPEEDVVVFSVGMARHLLQVPEDL